MKKLWSMAVLLILMLSLGAAPMVSAQGSKSPEAEKIIQQMCDLLAAKSQFTYRAAVSYEEIGDNGEKLTHGFATKTFVRRPDRLRVDAAGEKINKDLFFDGKSITLHDKAEKVYATMEAPPEIEDALEMAHKDFGLRVALADLASPKLAELMLNQSHDSRYLGKEDVQGVSCHHLALSREDVEVLLWVDAGSDPVLQKIVITHTDTPERPQWTAILSDWDLAPSLEDNVFIFTAPADVQKIKFVLAEKADDPDPEDPSDEEGAQQ